MAVGGVVAVHTIDQSGNTQTNYIHSDHLGSLDTITADNGNIATDPATGGQQVMSFDAFGLRRDPNNWYYDGCSVSLGFEVLASSPLAWLVVADGLKGGFGCETASQSEGLKLNARAGGRIKSGERPCAG